MTQGSISDLAGQYAADAEVASGGLKAILALCLGATRNLTALSFFLMAAGILLASPALLREPGLPRITGGVGLLSGSGSVVMLLAGKTSFTPFVLFGFLAAVGIWNLLVSVLLLRTSARR